MDADGIRERVAAGSLRRRPRKWDWRPRPVLAVRTVSRGRPRRVLACTSVDL